MLISAHNAMHCQPMMCSTLTARLVRAPLAPPQIYHIVSKKALAQEDGPAAVRCPADAWEACMGLVNRLCMRHYLQQWPRVANPHFIHLHPCPGLPPVPPLQAPSSGTAIKVTEAAPEAKKKGSCCQSA